MKTRFNFPTKILFGQGVLYDLAAQVKVLSSKRPLLVTDEGLAGTDIPERIRKILENDGLEPVIFSGVSPNPTDAQVDAGAAAFREHHADSIVAVGGGSPLDAGKAVQIRIHHKEPLEEYDDLKGGDIKILGPLPPLVAIPTTAGTGSEVSRAAVITVRAVDRKVVLFSPRIMPAVAVCDPELTYGLPPRITAETGMDALSHSLEAFMAKGYHPMADGIALRAIRMISDNLPVAVASGNDVKARQEMLMASTMGAVAFQKGLGVIHSLAHPLSSVAGISHGLANAIMMPHAVRFNGQQAAEAAASVAHALGSKDVSVEGAALAIEELASRIDLPTSLSEAGVEEEQIPDMVEKALADGCHADNPVACDADAFESLYQAAL